jgi:hypothetical protein
LPVSFVDNVRARLRGLGPEAAQVLRVAAVIGRQFDWTLLASAAEVADVQVMSALRAGVDAQLRGRTRGAVPLPARTDEGRGARRHAPG